MDFVAIFAKNIHLYKTMERKKEQEKKLAESREQTQHTPIMQAAMKYKGSITINDPAFYL